ncbi:hypothetical protein VT84_13765 [Gemmata sp. SH-PL17]|nr:hypothetical protein VT84_13765 [Gemmata sp. SH-PL17]
MTTLSAICYLVFAWCLVSLLVPPLLLVFAGNGEDE